MKHLIDWKLFESNYQYSDDEILKDVVDITIELNDSGRISSRVLTSQKFGTYVGFFVKDTLDMGGFLFDEIEDYVYRIKDYLGDRYKECSALFQDRYRDMDHFYNVTREEIDLDNTEEVDSIREREIKNLIIQINMNKEVYENWVGNDTNFIISELEDICVELNDMNIITQCNYNLPNPKHPPSPSIREHISVELEKATSDYRGDMEEFKWVEIHDTILRILEFMNSNGWKPSYFIFDGESNHTEFLSFNKIIEWLNFRKDYLLFSLKIDFIRK